MAASRTTGVGGRDRARRSLEEINLPHMNMARGRTLQVVDLVGQAARRAWRRIKQQPERRVSRKAGEAMLVAAGLDVASGIAFQPGRNIRVPSGGPEAWVTDGSARLYLEDRRLMSAVRTKVETSLPNGLPGDP